MVSNIICTHSYSFESFLLIFIVQNIFLALFKVLHIIRTALNWSIRSPTFLKQMLNWRLGVCIKPTPVSHSIWHHGSIPLFCDMKFIMNIREENTSRSPRYNGNISLSLVVLKTTDIPKTSCTWRTYTVQTLNNTVHARYSTTDIMHCTNTEQHCTCTVQNYWHKLYTTEHHCTYTLTLTVPHWAELYGVLIYIVQNWTALFGFLIYMYIIQHWTTLYNAEFLYYCLLVFYSSLFIINI